jgi:anaerobic selenocysteine-containing dehydrogenase
MKTESINIKNDEKIWEDVWINTMCHRCQAECGIRAHRVNGVVVKLEGNPDSSIGSGGGLCPKGMAGIQVLYDPNRLNVPLKRTNPEKGVGVDPMWEEISWDEALDEISTRLKAAYDKDPSRIVVQHGIVSGNQIGHYYAFPMLVCLSNEKGPATHSDAGGAHCGNAGHFLSALNYASFVIMPDFNYCNYQIVFGTNTGNGGFMQYISQLAADARRRGMKLVVFDPVCNNAASKADEWIPITPGTDGIVCLAMLDVIVNELGIMDAPYLKEKTNASYLIGHDGHYVRDKETNKPMVWDSTASKAKTFDDSSVGDIGLEGTYEVQGVKCSPAWVLLKERFKEYPPEKAASISGVPAETIRRIATEYAQAAQIGKTINIEGHELPYRPVATLNIRSAGTHKNGAQTLFAMDMLHHVVGAANVPGATVSVSMECFGHPETNKPRLVAASCPDGLLRTGGKWLFPQGGPWPLRNPEVPKHDLGEMFPCAMEVPMLNATDREEVLKKAGIYQEYDILINCASNAIMNAVDPNVREKYFKSMPFVVDIDIFSNEFNEAFADILLPDACYLERSDFMGIQHTYHTQPPTLDRPWCCHISQAVVEPMYQRRDSAQVVIDILTRMGLGPKLNMLYNWLFGLDEKRAFQPDDKIVWDDFCNRAVLSAFGDGYDWEWFKKNGFISWPKKVEEVYWGAFRKGIRRQIYWEFMLGLKEDVGKISREIGLEEYIDMKQYDPRPMWTPIPAHEVEDASFDLYAFSWGDAMHGNSNTQEQPWIDEVSKMNPFTYYVNINEDTAKAKSMKAGDLVEIESSRGLKVQGMLQIRKGILPHALTVMGVSGHWAKGLPIAKGKGVNFNSLIDFRFEDMDPISGSTEVCVKVKVKKIG